MNQQPLFHYLFNMLDYADQIMARIVPGDSENNAYFMTLVYVESIFDTYGRGLVRESAREAGHDDAAISEISKLANVRLEMLRKNIRALSQQYDFDEMLKNRAEGMYKDWHKQSEVSA